MIGGNKVVALGSCPHAVDRYRFDGKEKRLSLGVYPDVGLKEARDRRDAARKLLVGGVNPSANRKAQKAARTDRAANRFEILAREWYAKFSSTWADLHRDPPKYSFASDPISACTTSSTSALTPSPLSANRPFPKPRPGPNFPSAIASSKLVVSDAMNLPDSVATLLQQALKPDLQTLLYTTVSGLPCRRTTSSTGC